MDLTLTFDRGNNVYTTLALTREEMRSVAANRAVTGDYGFLYDRGALARALGHEPPPWAPGSFTAYEEDTRVLVRVDKGKSREIDVAETNVVFGEPARHRTTPAAPVTVVLGFQGRAIIQYAWKGLEGPFDPAKVTLRVTSGHHAGETLLVVSEVLYDGRLAEKHAPQEAQPDWVWEPVFLYAEDAEENL